MAQRQYPQRLRKERFAQGRGKPVVELPGFRASAARLRLTDEHKDQLDDVIERLEAGDLLPEDRYRNGICRDRDEMLDVYGVKHLHLGETKDDILVFVVEYPEKVVLLGLHGHAGLAGQPRGSVLYGLYCSHLWHEDQRSEEASITLRQRIRESLFARRRKEG